MSRWIDASKNNDFYPVWHNYYDLVKKLNIDESTSTDAVKEIARLKKIITLIHNIQENIDPELVPIHAYSSWAAQAQTGLHQVLEFNSSKNIGYLQNSNGSADNLFGLIRPYMVVPAKALESYGEALSEYTKTVNSYFQTFENSARQSQSALSIASGETVAQKKRIDEVEARVRGFHDYLFSSTSESTATETRVKGMVDKIASDQKAITELHEKLFHGPDSTSQIILGYERDIKLLRERMTGIADAATDEHAELKVFYQRIFGGSNDGGDDSQKQGLKNELDTRLKELAEFEENHDQRHEAMFKKVESLLPGATSAGLATSYKSLKDSFDKPIKNYTKAFYGSLVFLLFSGLLMIFDFSTEPFKIELVKAHEWTEMLRTLLVRAPVVIPVVWFAVFSATRRSQYERLQQEYAHKEALASSYEGYKKQLQDLKMEAEDLQKELIAKSINAIAYNASTTLDGKHTEKPPVFQMLEKLNADDIKKMIDMVRQK